MKAKTATMVLRERVTLRWLNKTATQQHSKKKIRVQNTPGTSIGWIIHKKILRFFIWTASNGISGFNAVELRAGIWNCNALRIHCLIDKSFAALLIIIITKHAAKMILRLCVLNLWRARHLHIRMSFNPFERLCARLNGARCHITQCAVMWMCARVSLLSILYLWNCIYCAYMIRDYNPFRVAMPFQFVFFRHYVYSWSGDASSYLLACAIRTTHVERLALNVAWVCMYIVCMLDRYAYTYTAYARELWIKAHSQILCTCII